MGKHEILIGTCILVFLIAGFMVSRVDASTGVSSIDSNFKGTTINAGSWIWFTCVIKTQSTPVSGDIVELTSSTITINGLSGPITVPNAVITFSSSVSSATTSFDSSTNTWLTTAPLSTSGNTFLSGLAYKVPASPALRGANPVTWSGTFDSNEPAFSLKWQWAAAVYTTLPVTGGGTPDYNNFGVLAADGSGPHAGTPQNYDSYVTGGATGGGGSNYTGSYSGTGKVGCVQKLIVATPEAAVAILMPATGLVAFACFRTRAKQRKQK